MGTPGLVLGDAPALFVQRQRLQGLQSVIGRIAVEAAHHVVDAFDHPLGGLIQEGPDQPQVRRQHGMTPPGEGVPSDLRGQHHAQGTQVLCVPGAHGFAHHLRQFPVARQHQPQLLQALAQGDIFRLVGQHVAVAHQFQVTVDAPITMGQQK